MQLLQHLVLRWVRSILQCLVYKIYQKNYQKCDTVTSYCIIQMNLKTNYFQLQLDEGMWQYIPTFCDRESLTCDIDSDPTGIPVPVRWNLGWYRFRSGTGRFGRYQTDSAIFSCCIIGFMMSYLNHVPPPVPWLDHVHPSSSQTVSRATLQFPDCITCSPLVPWLYHVLPSSSQTVSRSTLEFTNCFMPPPPAPLATLGEENNLYVHRLLLLLISH